MIRNKEMAKDRTWHQAGRSILLCIALLLCPLLMLLWPEPPTAIWYVLLIWKGLVFPHDWLVQRTGHGFIALLPGYWAVTVATVQWALCSLLLGWFTRSYSAIKQLGVVVVAIGLVGLTLLLGAVALGIEIQPDLI